MVLARRQRVQQDTRPWIKCSVTKTRPGFVDGPQKVLGPLQTPPVAGTPEPVEKLLV